MHGEAHCHARRSLGGDGNTQRLSGLMGREAHRKVRRTQWHHAVAFQTVPITTDLRALAPTESPLTSRTCFAAACVGSS